MAARGPSLRIVFEPTPRAIINMHLMVPASALSIVRSSLTELASLEHAQDSMCFISGSS